MFVKIQTSALASGNSGSCRALAYYLEKENENKPLQDMNFFFSQTEERVYVEEVIKQIDQNGKGGIRKEEAKFYSIVFAPSQQELEHIGNSMEKLQEYTRKAMELYAENFNKGLTGKDIVWYAKIEHSRTYKREMEIPLNKKKGDEKEGLQTHIHVIVSRKTTDKKKLISPLANERGKVYKIGGKEMVKGFDRNAYKENCEKLFDKLFSYPRQIEEHFSFMKGKSKARTIEEKLIYQKFAQNPKSNLSADKQEKPSNELKNTDSSKKKILLEMSKKNFEKLQKEKRIKRHKNEEKISKKLT